MTADKPLRIVGESVVNKAGERIANRPEEVPLLAARCAALAKTWETGETYRVRRDYFDERGNRIEQHQHGNGTFGQAVGR